MVLYGVVLWYGVDDMGGCDMVLVSMYVVGLIGCM
jgi:hypothetical protein